MINPLFKLLTACCLAQLAAVNVVAEITRHTWVNIPGDKISDLVAVTNYPDIPDFIDFLPNIDNELNVRDHIGTRLLGYIHPPSSGNYVFWLAGDDESELWLSTDDDPANRVRIGHVPEWSLHKQWDKFPEQESPPIRLTAGSRYYIEVLSKEGEGGDNLTVGWTPPGSNGVFVITDEFVTPFQAIPPNIPRRYANNTLNFPSALASTGYEIERAFGGLNFEQPLNIVSPPGETNRVFIVEKTGRIQVIPDLTAPTKQVFLDLSSVVTLNSESGLLSMAFHPGYAINGLFYVYYSLGYNNNPYQRVAQFLVDANNPNLADANSEVPIIDHIDRSPDHQGGDMHFGPDEGYLYISMGDEGYANDFYDNAQQITSGMWSGILRIDVDRNPANLLPNAHPAVMTDAQGAPLYHIPADNPWVGATNFLGAAIDPADVRTEFWAIGLRNPWRMAFDDQTGELWLGDVGQDKFEEVNIIRKGGNYGWAAREGFIAGPKPGQVPQGTVLDDPYYAYGRSDGGSITGGIVYYGSDFPELAGRYIYADYLSGTIAALRQDGTNVVSDKLYTRTSITDFGVDPSDGEVLMADLTGKIWRLIADSGSGGNTEFPEQLSDTGAFSNLDELTPMPGVVSYEVNVPFWSDYAIKRRWFSVPAITNLIGYASDGNWDFPTGTVWIKHFDLELERGNPATKKRIETRFLVKTEEGAYGLSYRWNEAQTDADLVPIDGDTFNIDLVGGGQQLWSIPSRQACLQCHTEMSGFALSFNTRQINCSSIHFGVETNQLSLLADIGYFDSAPGDPALAARLPRPDEVTSPEFEPHVRAYLDVNCAVCHQPGAAAPPSWDARYNISLAETGLINGEPGNNGGDTNLLLVVEGRSDRSLLLHRMKACCGFGRMPAIGTNELDQDAIALVRDWIDLGLIDDTYKTISLDVAGNQASVNLARLIERGYEIEVSEDMVSWLPWNVPENDSELATATGNKTVNGPITSAPARFFRAKVTGPPR